MKRDAKGRFVSEEKVYAKGYKGFNPGLVCITKFYKENTIFEEPFARMCEKGMHFCKKAKDVLFYYPFLNSFCKLNEFAEVKALAKIVNRGNKSVTTKLKILDKLSTKKFISHIVSYFSARFKTAKQSSSPVQTSQKSGATLCTSYIDARLAGAGNNMELLAGEYRSKLVSAGDLCSLYAEGYSNMASAGDSTQMISLGVKSALAASGCGNELITTGSEAAMASSGWFCGLTAIGIGSRLASTGDATRLVALGKDSRLASAGSDVYLYAEGKCSRLVSAGFHAKIYAAGEDSVAISASPEGKVKGKLGCFLGCMEWQEYLKNGHWHQKPLSFASGLVDGKKIKPDTWYTAKDGQLVEVEE